MLIEAYTYKPAQNVTLTEGQSATFTCTVYPETWRSGQVHAYYAKYDKYICKDPCGPHDWHLVMAATDETLAPNRNPRFTMTKIPHSNGAQITISDVKFADAGTYWCGIEYPNSDMYRQLRVVVNKQPDTFDTPLNILSNVETTTSTSEIDYHLDNLSITDHKDDTVQKALRQCNDNSACALALLHKKELKIPGDCWICHALTVRWQARPLTANVVLQSHMKESRDKEDHGKCTVPLGMMTLLLAGQQIRNNVSVTPHPNIICTDSHPTPNNMAFEVPLQHAETCVCSASSSGPYLGQSGCQTKIFVNTTASTNCSHRWPNNTLTRFACPFNQLSSQPGIVWSCGKKAYHKLPPQFQWSGCCHPSIVTTDTKVLHKETPTINTQSTMHFQAHRDITGVPSKFDGYVLADPWTSPSANVGWSLFLGGGTTAALNKINGIAWSVLSLANHTEAALTLVNTEMSAIRTAVIQHRLALDIILAEKGGICKMLNVSCCFYIPDEYENITNIIKHMQDAIQPPPVADDSWFSWLRSWGRGWSSWFLTMIIPIVAISFLFCTIIPCMLKWLSDILTRKIIQSSTYVHVNINDHQDSTSFHIPDPHHYSSSDLDSDDDIL